MWRMLMMTEYSMVLAENIQDCSLDYQELEGSVKNLMQMHDGLETQIREMKTPFHKFYAKLKRSLFGAPKHSAEEVMNMQLMIIRQIRRALEFNSNKTRTKLDTIINYSEASDLKIEENLQYRAREKPRLEETRKILETLSSTIQKEDKTKQGFFEKEHDYKKVLRGYKENTHKYDLATDAVLDLLQQGKYLGLQEEIIRNTVHTSERLSEKTRRIENQISIVKGLYDSVLKQHKLYVTLYQAICAQKTYISNLDDILMNGQQVMEQIATKSNVLNGFNENPRLEGISENIEYVNLDRRSEKELLLAEYLGR